jgi:hypothetical protein
MLPAVNRYINLNHINFRVMSDINPVAVIRIAMVVCYFGEFPWYFRFFVKSCFYNPDIDFIIVTDNILHESLPANVKIVNRSLAEIRQVARDKLSFEIALHTPYKFCDFKPVYGLLFEDLLQEYDFWGHGDIDVVYGQIRKFITDDILHKHDVICVRPEYVSGFFTLFRNNRQMRELFKESKDYQRVFQNPGNYCFDECNWNWNELLEGKSIFSLKADVQCMTYVIRKLTLCNKLRSYFAMHVIEGQPGKLEWNKGRLVYNKQEEYLLYHFIQFKELQYKYIPSWKTIPDHFYIGRFYISKYSAWSLMGILAATGFRMRKTVEKLYQSAIQYSIWLRKYFTASRKIKHDQLPNLHLLAGTYRNSIMAVDVSLNNGSLFAEWDDNPRLLLLHRNGHEFIAGKFNIKQHLNIDVSFHFDDGKSRYVLHVIPYFFQKEILHKD